MVIRNHTHHAVTYASLWPGETGWSATTLLPGQVQVYQRTGKALPLEVLYETPTGHGPRERLAVLSPFSLREQVLVYDFRAGPGGKVNLS